jgi:hypothetical protein
MAGELKAILGRLIDRALEEPGFPPRATSSPRALLVHSTDALYSYYIDEAGAVYELDLDRALVTLDAVVDPDRIRETYAAAATGVPELAGLLTTPGER